MTHMQEFSFRQINIEEHHHDLALLQQEHYHEVINTDINYSNEPDFDMLYKLNQAKMLHSIGIFSGGKMVGYSVNMLCTPIYDKKVKIFTNLLFFIQKSGRVGRNGINLIKLTEKLGSDLGANQLNFSVGKETVFDNILSRYGYASREVVRNKKL